MTRGAYGGDQPSARRLVPQTAGAGWPGVSRPALLSSIPPAPGGAPAGTAFRGPVAFAFQGGGSLAACQVGMLRALTGAGIVPDLVVGSSAGALNAVAFAAEPRSGPDSLDALDELWMSLRRRHVAPLSPRMIVRALTGRADGLFANDSLRAVVERHLPRRLQDTAVPAHVVATDMGTGRPVVLSRGETPDAVLASSAFPGLYAPVPVAGRMLIDGGVSADMPVLQAEALGAATTFALPAAVSEDRDAPMRGPMPLAYRALGQILDGMGRRDVAGASGDVLVLPAPTSNAANPIDFRDTRRLIDDGYQLASTWLEAEAWRATPTLAAPLSTVPVSQVLAAVQG